MARVAPLPTKGSALYFVIDHSVGKGGRNLLPDVQLIQIHLNKVMDDREIKIRAYPDIWKGQELKDAEGVPIQRLKVDGLCGPKTLAAILAFQQKFAALAKDGLVSAIRSHDKSGYIRSRQIMYKTMFTLVIESHIYAETTIADITVEPLRGILIKSVIDQHLGALGRLWLPASKVQNS